MDGRLALGVAAVVALAVAGPAGPLVLVHAAGEGYTIIEGIRVNTLRSLVGILKLGLGKELLVPGVHLLVRC